MLSLILWSSLQVFAAYLICVGLLGKRVAVEPQCRHCGYCVAYRQGGRCPECGTFVDRPGSIITWKRKKNKVLVCCGVSVEFVTVLMVQWARNIPVAEAIVCWVAPSTELAKFIGSGDELLSCEAARQLQTRTTGTSRESAMPEAVGDILLRLLDGSATPTAERRCLSILGSLHDSGFLSIKQRQTFFAHTLNYKVTPVVRTDKDNGVTLIDSWTSRFPSQWDMRLNSKGFGVNPRVEIEIAPVEVFSQDVSVERLLDDVPGEKLGRLLLVEALQWPICRMSAANVTRGNYWIRFRVSCCILVDGRGELFRDDSQHVIYWNHEPP